MVEVFSGGLYGDCGSFSGNRGFLTRGEKIEMLSEYKKNLEKEAKGVFPN